MKNKEGVLLATLVVSFFLLVSPVKAWRVKKIPLRPVKKAVRLEKKVKRRVLPLRREGKKMIGTVRKGKRIERRVREKKKRIKENVQERQERRREFWKKRKEEFQARLKKIKSARRKRIVIKVNQRLKAVNQRLVRRANRYVDHLAVILERIEARKNKIKEKGVDVAAAEAKITAIKGMIASARETIKNQEGKDYTPQIGAEDKLRATVGQSYQNLKADAKTVYQAVVGIRKEMVGLVNLLASLQGVK